eukprot:TRINITY_DN1723_c0_g1_i1.p1 TRINITY_DN1723_c0_g1~~TRINITY_DN1723_c0_g1_i1.p1  ORF type:complete len:109 (+),score=22.15 TRINITY_DN1723_c0_g1_i1:85-411(+)
MEWELGDDYSEQSMTVITPEQAWSQLQTQPDWMITHVLNSMETVLSARDVVPPNLATPVLEMEDFELDMTNFAFGGDSFYVNTRRMLMYMYQLPDIDRYQSPMGVSKY